MTDEQPDFQAATITVDDRGLSENTYKPSSCWNEKVQEIYAQLTAAFPETATENVFDWALLGLSHGNGQNYRENTVSVFHEGPPSEDIRKEFGVPLDLCCVDAHTLKFGLVSKTKYLKVYQGDWWNLRLPQLPEGACLGTNFGMGRHFGNKTIKSLRDVYFYHHDQELVSDYCRLMGVEAPYPMSFFKGVGLYGVQFEVEGMRPVRVKRYYHPLQPEITDRLNL